MAQASDVSLLLVAVVVCSVFVVNYAEAATGDQTGSVFLVSGETLYSQSHEYSISFERCNLKVYKHCAHDQLIWQSGMADENVNFECHMSLQSDGNAVIFSGSNPLWASNIGTSLQGAHILVTEHNSTMISFRQKNENGRVMQLVFTQTTSTEQDSQATDTVSVEFDLATQSALNQAPILSPDVQLIPQFLKSPVQFSTPQSQFLLKTSLDMSSTPAHERKKIPRHYRFFSQSVPSLLSSPEVEGFRVDSTRYQHETPSGQNSPVLPSSSPSNFGSPSSKSKTSTLTGTGNAPLDFAPSHAGNTPQHGDLLYVLIESPAQSAPQSELSDAQLNWSSKSASGSSIPSGSTEAPVQSSTATDVSSRPLHDTPASELKTAARVKSSPAADGYERNFQVLPSSPVLVDLTSGVECRNSPVDSAPVHSVPRAENSPVDYVYTPAGGELRSSMAKFSAALELESSPAEYNTPN